MQVTLVIRMRQPQDDRCMGLIHTEPSRTFAYLLGMEITIYHTVYIAPTQGRSSISQRYRESAERSLISPRVRSRVARPFAACCQSFGVVYIHALIVSLQEIPSSKRKVGQQHASGEHVPRNLQRRIRACPTQTNHDPERRPQRTFNVSVERR